MLNRLREAIQMNLPLVDDIAPEAQANLAGEGFALGAKWELEEPNEDVVEDKNERMIDGVAFREPTVGEGGVVENVEFVTKRNYGLEFDRPVFISSCKQPKRENGKLVFDADKKIVYENQPHTNTLPNLDFFHSKNINTESHPADWYNCFLPIKRQNTDLVLQLSIAEITSWPKNKHI